MLFTKQMFATPLHPKPKGNCVQSTFCFFFVFSLIVPCRHTLFVCHSYQLFQVFVATMFDYFDWKIPFSYFLCHQIPFNWPETLITQAINTPHICPEYLSRCQPLSPLYGHAVQGLLLFFHSFKLLVLK